MATGYNEYSLSYAVDEPEVANVHLIPDADPTRTSVEPDCSQFTFVTYVGVFGAMCTFGLIGNSLSWAVLGWERRNRGRVATLLLQTMAVVDNLFLLAAGVSQISMALKVYLMPPILPTADNGTALKLDSASASNHSSSNSSAVELVASAFRCDVGADGGGAATQIEQLIGYHVIGGVGCAEDVGTVAPSVDAFGAEVSPTPAVGGGSSFACFIVYISAYVAVFVFPLVHVTQMWTVWITVLVAFNRYVAICRPFHASQVCTMKQTTRQIMALGIAILIYCLPRFFEYRITYEPEEYFGGRDMPIEVETQMKSNLVYNVVYENLLYCLFVFLGPLVIIAVLNACLVHELVSARRRRRSQQVPLCPGRSSWVAGGTTNGGRDVFIGASCSTTSGEQNLTLVMVVIVLIFVVCQTPAFVNQVLFSLIGYNDYQCGKVYFYYFHVSNVIVSANSSVNFVVYCVFRRQFRHRLRDCCRGQRERRVTICQSSLYGPRRGIVVTTRNTAHGINDVMHYPLRVVVPTVNWGSVSDRETTPTAGSRNV